MIPDKTVLENHHGHLWMRTLIFWDSSTLDFYLHSCSQCPCTWVRPWASHLKSQRSCVLLVQFEPPADACSSQIMRHFLMLYLFCCPEQPLGVSNCHSYVKDEEIDAQTRWTTHDITQPPWIAARQASLSITNSRSLLKLMPVELAMPSNHLILCCPLFLLPSVFPSIRVVSNESVLCIRWPKCWLQHRAFSFNISPSNEYSGLISFRMDWVGSPSS